MHRTKNWIDIAEYTILRFRSCRIGIRACTHRFIRIFDSHVTVFQLTFLRNFWKMDTEVINVRLRILGSDEVNEMELPVDTEIETFRILASEFTEMPMEEMALLFKGKQMEDGMRLSDYGIAAESVVHMVPKRVELENHKYLEKMRLVSEFNSKLLNVKSKVCELKNDLNGSDPVKINNAIRELNMLWKKEKTKLTEIRNELNKCDNDGNENNENSSNASGESSDNSIFSDEELQMIQNDSKIIQNYQKPDFDISYGYQSAEENYPFI